MRIKATLKSFWVENVTLVAVCLAGGEGAFNYASLNAVLTINAALIMTNTLQEV